MSWKTTIRSWRQKPSFSARTPSEPENSWAVLSAPRNPVNESSDELPVEERKWKNEERNDLHSGICALLSALSTLLARAPAPMSESIISVSNLGKRYRIQ